MRCEVHPDKEAVKFCGACGSAVCEDCLVNAGGTTFCKNCYSKQRKTYKTNDQLESLINQLIPLFRNKFFLLAVIVIIVLFLIIIIYFALNPMQTPDYMYTQNPF